MPSRRSHPLTAEPPGPTPAAAEPSAWPSPIVTHDVAPDEGPLAPTSSPQERERRFAAGLTALRVGGGSLALGERTLMILGGIIAPLGLLVILMGWVGASRTGLLFEQIPYLISGGIFGLGLVFLGSFFYFAHWLTELVKEHRTQSAAVVAAIGDLAQRLEQAERSGTSSMTSTTGASAATPNGAASPDQEDQPWLVTARGSLAHRPGCVVVAGKDGLRTIPAGEVHRRCQLCASDAPEG